MRKSSMRSIATLVACLSIGACSSGNLLHNSGEIDPGWSGLWHGKVLVENAAQPPKNFELYIDFSNNMISAFLSDSTEKLYQQPVRNLKLNGNEIHFSLAYETRRGLRSQAQFSGIRRGRSMMVQFTGSEGGRSFRGKWQAIHAPGMPEESPKKPAEALAKSPGS